MNFHDSGLCEVLVFVLVGSSCAHSFSCLLFYGIVQHLQGDLQCHTAKFLVAVVSSFFMHTFVTFHCNELSVAADCRA